jgi:glycosyltransferase involved in cell wall biosynthesis
MRIAYIAAGAGGMYCGSCLRDHTLAAELLSRGHEVHLIPTYTPLRTDEAGVSQSDVFLGGINVYLQQHSRLFRSMPPFLDRMWDSPSVLRLATRWGIRVDPAPLADLTVSMLRGTEGFQRKEISRLLQFLEHDVAPEVVNLPNALLLGLAPEIKERVRAPLFCTLGGEDLFLEGLPAPQRAEALALIRSHAASVDAFLAVSRYCADSMAPYLGIPRDKIRIVPLGIKLDGHRAAQRGEPDLFTIGYLARIAPEKGLDRLCAAYRVLDRSRPGAPSRLRAAGYLAPEHRAYLRRIESELTASGLSDRFDYAGTVDRAGKIEFLRSLSVLSVPSPYDEPKGLYLLEAMANGVPVVQPRRGAFPEIIERTGGGILVDTDEPEDLARALIALWDDPEKRRELGRRGNEGVRSHYSAATMADAALKEYESFL